MTERRRFNSGERVALFLAAGGRCAQCGAELQPGWHADHMTPYSRTHNTDTTNGQALCPTCNLKKGDRMTELRNWQSEALTKFLRVSGDFLAVATPGAGKTTFALAAAEQAMQLGVAQRLVVVVPTSHLRSQWAKAAAKVGIQLDHRFVNGSGAVARDFDGPVVTYAAVASEPLLFRKLSDGALVILDEVHHGGDNLAWGDALRLAFEPAARRLLLSGTPRRTDRAPIPFVTYDDDGNFIWSYKYDYGEALQDRNVVRPIEFLALDGQVRWREAGAVVATALVDADGDSLSNALGAALHPDGEWIASVLRRANDELTRHRMEVPDAGGLVVAAGQWEARRYATMLQKISGEQPTVAISDESDASERISSFASGNSRWLIAVQMVSEGVDIPRLAVGVYASKYRTELFFRQVVGRFVRMRTTDDPTSTLLVPSIEPLLRYAQEIERTVTKALDDEEKEVREGVKRDDQMPLRLDLVEPLDSSEAVHHSTILAGETFTDEELQRAQVILQLSPMPPTTTAAQMAAALRAAGMGRIVGSAVIKPEPPARPLADDKAALRRVINRKVGHLHHATDQPYGHIHAELNRICGDAVKIATVDTLNKRLEILDRWFEEA